MAHGRTCLGAGHGGAAGIGEQIQHADGTAGMADLLHGEVPVGGLFGEQPRVLEVHGLDLEGQLLIADGPALRQFLLIPVAAAGRRAAVAGVGRAPTAVAALTLPDGLRIGTHQYLLTPALQLLAAAAIQQLIILPTICYPHKGCTSAY